MRKLANSGISASGLTASLIVSIPNIRMAKPTRMLPTSRFFPSLHSIIRIIPITAMTGEKLSGLSSFIKRLSPCMPVRLRIHAVMVVPTFAPIIIPIACESFIIPELTKPTAITVVADED